MKNIAIKKILAGAALTGIVLSGASVVFASADTTPPIVEISAPITGSVTGGIVLISASTTDNVGVTGVKFLLDNNVLGIESTISPLGLMWNSTGTPNGMHTLLAVAHDASGNIATSSLVVITLSNASGTPDTTLPTVSLVTPATGITVNGVLVVSAIASDNVGVAGVQFLLDGVNLGAEDTTSPFSVSWNTLGSANSTHTLSAIVRDTSGNIASATPITVTVSNSLPDVVVPTVSIVAPITNATVNGASVTLTATASDNVGIAGVQFVLDGVKLGSEDTVAPYSINWNTTGVTNGTHSLVAVARDSSQNLATSSVISVTVNNSAIDTTLPVIAITSPLNNTTASGTVTLTAVASDNVGIAGVQFLLDGAKFGAENTTSPFHTLWNTMRVADGVHILSAIARDTSGNIAAATSVSITIANGVQLKQLCIGNHHGEDGDDHEDCNKENDDNDQDHEDGDHCKHRDHFIRVDNDHQFRQINKHK